MMRRNMRGFAAPQGGTDAIRKPCAAGRARKNVHISWFDRPRALRPPKRR